MMRILYVVTATAFGGAVKHVIHLMRFMVERGHKVALVAAPEPHLMREARILRATVFTNPDFVFSFSLYHDLRAFIPVFRAIHHFQPDLVSCHSTKAGLVARFCAAMIRKPVIFTVHGWGFAERRAWWIPWVLRQLERLAARVTTKIICVSEFDKKLALKFGIARPEQLVVIHNGEPAEPYIYTSRTNVTGLDPTIITVGRLAPPKDFQTLLQSLKKLNSGRMVLVGDGPIRPWVERFIVQNGLNNRVYLLGERDDVKNLLTKADIFVLSSKKEGLPQAIIEAMLTGLPVVASRVGGVPELVEDGITGFLVPPGDPDALVIALKNLCEDPELRRRMGEAGQKKALQEFTLDRMLAETQKVYEEVLNTKQR